MRFILLSAVFLLVACGQESAYVPGEWLGRWTGVEGTYMEIAQKEDKLEIVISDLDGPKTYQGTISGDKVVFERNGQEETIHPGNGVDTGMKWLSDKENCLVIL